MYVLLAYRDDNQSKGLAYLMSRGTVNNYIQRYMAEYPENSWEQLKSLVECEICWSKWLHHALTMLHKARQVKDESVQVYAERLYPLANDTFAKVDKVVV